MECWKCGNDEGITAISVPMGPMDAVTYQFNCPCGAIWKRSWGMRSRDAGAKRRAEMANVEVLPSRMERHMAALKRNECPRCGKALTVERTDDSPIFGPLVGTRVIKTCPECQYSSATLERK